ncbi:hypothetical protein Ddye_000656 [Dipteronia dyeriana]|uniref:Uncharacterized protein n=1 Tax=Dipteronia dyeriana TaxID=168575 RepID=A0AAE0CSR5_9ROSI|nr:hypothetical protein Ddye_000656 [Dipteronia dyeriana]
MGVMITADAVQSRCFFYLRKIQKRLGLIIDPQPEPIRNICGDCGMENTLKPGDVIQCRECGYRILFLYKRSIPVELSMRPADKSDDQ